MKVLIVDDESPARNRVYDLLKNKPEIKELHQAESGKEALNKIREHQPDLLYLDINLNDMTAFDVLNQVQMEPKPVVIFVTAYDYYALNAFDYNARDFLVKPFKDERFEKSFKFGLEQSLAQKSKNYQQGLERLLSLQQKKEPIKQLPINLGNRTIFVQTEDIKYICADRYYAEIFTSKNKYVLRESLSNLINMLDNDIFIRVHRSTILSKHHIQEILHSDYSEIDIRVSDGKLFRVSRSKKKKVFSFLGL